MPQTRTIRNKKGGSLKCDSRSSKKSRIRIALMTCDRWGRETETAHGSRGGQEAEKHVRAGAWSMWERVYERTRQKDKKSIAFFISTVYCTITKQYEHGRKSTRTLVLFHHSPVVA